MRPRPRSGSTATRLRGRAAPAGRGPPRAAACRGRRRAGSRTHLAGQQGAGHRRDGRHGVQPHRGVALEQRAPGGVAVPGADVARAPVGVDDGDDAEVGQRRDDEPGQVRRRRLGVQGAGQLGADLGQDRQALGRLLGPLLDPPALGDLEEVHRQPVGARPGAQLVPAVQRRGVVGVEGDRLPGPDGGAVAVLEGAVEGGRPVVPDAPGRAGPRGCARAAARPRR